MTPIRFFTAIIALSITASFLSCSVTKPAETETVPADQFFMLVLEIVDESGTLVFTPIFEDWKEGRLKSFGPGPDGSSNGFWRVDHVTASGEVVSSEWVKDPMQAEYEYSEDGTTLEKVSFKLKNTALALRVPVRVHGKSNDVGAIEIYQVVNEVKEEQLLYKYELKN